MMLLITGSFAGIEHSARRPAYDIAWNVSIWQEGTTARSQRWDEFLELVAFHDTPPLFRMTDVICRQ